MHTGAACCPVCASARCWLGLSAVPCRTMYCFMDCWPACSALARRLGLDGGRWMPPIVAAAAFVDAAAGVGLCRLVRAAQPPAAGGCSLCTLLRFKLAAADGPLRACVGHCCWRRCCTAAPGRVPSAGFRSRPAVLACQAGPPCAVPAAGASAGCCSCCGASCCMGMWGGAAGGTCVCGTWPPCWIGPRSSMSNP